LPFGKAKLLTVKQEKKFKKILIKLRAEGLTARQIAERLNFGKEGVYQKLNVDHVYHFIKAFNLKRIKKRKVKKNDNVKEEYKNLYFKWRPGMPQCVVDSLRKEGFLLNDPELVKKNE